MLKVGSLLLPYPNHLSSPSYPYTMKRSFLLLAGSLLTWLPIHADRYTDTAEKHLNWAISNRADSILAHATPEVKQALPADQLNSIWKMLVMQFGTLESKEAWETTDLGDGLTLCRRLLHFKNRTLNVNIVLNRELQLSGISFTPAIEEKMRHEVDAKPLPAGITEQELNVEHNNISLPGTLTLPECASANQQVPVVVLLGGSGPTDRDGTLGPNHPLRDLAHGLALQGIASLRYDKRTKAHQADFAEVSGKRTTLETEYVEDALVALEKVRNLPEIDKKRVFLAGHSLGGTVLPLIARKAGKEVAGMIVLAGLARPMWEATTEQLRYLASLQETDPQRIDSMAESQLKQMLQLLPEDYLQSIDNYHPLQTVKKLRKLPMLFVQGGTDYQVTQEDLALWKQACRRNKRAQFAFFPDLDHLFRPQAKKAVPSDYQKEGTLSKEVVEAVAKFVQKD